MPLEKGSLLNNRYRIIETIASGGMGAIYRATDETLGILVAVKENFFANEDFLRQFRREATILAGLRHPNLPRVTDHFVIDSQGQYLVMDFIEGHDLREIISGHGALPEDEVVRIGVAICDALGYMHSRSPAIVHRDIKPGNIKITPAGKVYLVDFGLAKLSKGDATTVGAQALTPGYAPPEQYGQGTEPRSDLYGLGATLYAMLTGRVPVDGLSRVMGSAALTPIRQLNPLVSEAVAIVIEHAMAIPLTGRFQDARSFKQALLEAAPRVNPGQMITIDRTTPSAAAVYPPAAPPRPASSTQAAPPNLYNGKNQAIPEAKPQQHSPVQKRRASMLIPIVAGLVGVSLVIGVVLMMLLIPQLRKQNITSAITSKITENTTMPAVTPPTQPPTIPPNTPLPSATYSVTLAVIPSNTPPPLPTETDVPVSTATSLPVLESSPVSTETGEIAFSSDRDGSYQIWIINEDGENARQVTHLADGACQPAWSPDGKRLVFTSPCNGKKEDYSGSSLYLINGDGTGLYPLSSMPGGDFDPAWSPDGNQIAFTSLRDNGIPHIYLYNLSENTATRLSRVVNHERQPDWSPDGNWLAYQTTRLGEPQIWIMTPSGENAREFSTLSGSYEWMPVWAPDGSVLVYSQGNPSRLVSRLVSDKFAKELPISDQVTNAEGTDFSPDGEWLIFETKIDNNLDLYRMTSNGNNLTRLTDHVGIDFHPAWRPFLQP